MKRIIAGLLFAAAVYVSSLSTASAASSRTAGNAQEFQEELDSGAAEITITSSFRGNFFIPRWVSSITGKGRNIMIVPSVAEKPVFKAENSTSRQTSLFNPTADSLKISNIEIICPGVCGAIDANSISKPLSLSKVKFIGPRKTNRVAVGCKPSTVTEFTDCTFENLKAGVLVADSKAEYDIKIRGCKFSRVSQALDMEKTNLNAKASIENCKGSDVDYWVSQQSTGNLCMYVTVDQATLDSYKDSDYYHRSIEALELNNIASDTQLRGLKEDFESAFNKLPEGAKKLILREKSRGWDSIRVYAMMHLNRKKDKEIDYSPENRHIIDECAELYALLASAPMASVLGNDGKIDNSQLFALYEDVLRGMVRDENLIKPLVWGYDTSTHLGPLTRIGARISWGNSGNVREALGKIGQNPDRIFRKYLNMVEDSRSALDEAKKKLEEINRTASSKYQDTEYSHKLENTLRNIHDFSVAANRLARAIFFDLPIDVSFAVNFARVTAESNKAKIVVICRELGSFYRITGLCVLMRTQTLRNELLKVWKEALTEYVYFPIPHPVYDKYNELLLYLKIDPDSLKDTMEDKKMLEQYFGEWH